MQMNTESSLHTEQARRAHYRQRFEKVAAYIDACPDGDLSLDSLSALAAMSRFHFHRQFASVFGLSLHQYVLQSRLRRAGSQLAFRTSLSVTRIALDHGFESLAAFSRAFRQMSGQSPTAFRAAPDWPTWHQACSLIPANRSVAMNFAHQDVRILDFPATALACMEHCGDPALIGDTLQKFIAWRRQEKLPPSRYRTFNIMYAHPDHVPAAEFRLDVGVAVDQPESYVAAGIIAKTIPAGRCAVLRHTGPDSQLEHSIGYLFNTWLPASGEELRDFPVFLQRLRFYPDVSEQQAEVDIFLPLK